MAGPVEHVTVPGMRLTPHMFSHGAKAAGFFYVSGQVGMDDNSKLVEGGIEAHTLQCIKSFERVLKHGGSSLQQVTKVNIYLKDMNDFEKINKVYEDNWPSPKPARTCIQAGGLPVGAIIEMDCVATY